MGCNIKLICIGLFRYIVPSLHYHHHHYHHYYYCRRRRCCCCCCCYLAHAHNVTWPRVVSIHVRHDVTMHQTDWPTSSRGSVEPLLLFTIRNGKQYGSLPPAGNSENEKQVTSIVSSNETRKNRTKNSERKNKEQRRYRQENEDNRSGTVKCMNNMCDKRQLQWWY